MNRQTLLALTSLTLCLSVAQPTRADLIDFTGNPKASLEQSTKELRHNAKVCGLMLAGTGAAWVGIVLHHTGRNLDIPVKMLILPGLTLAGLAFLCDMAFADTADAGELAPMVDERYYLFDRDLGTSGQGYNSRLSTMWGALKQNADRDKLEAFDAALVRVKDEGAIPPDYFILRSYINKLLTQRFKINRSAQVAAIAREYDELDNAGVVDGVRTTLSQKGEGILKSLDGQVEMCEVRQNRQSEQSR